jgi:anamorsin
MALFDFSEAHCSSAVLVVDDAEGEGVAAFMDRYPSVCVGAGAAALEGLAPSSLGSVLFATSAPWEELLPGALAALKPTGRLVVRQPAAAFARDDASMALLLGGFVDAVLPEESLFAGPDAGTAVVQMLAAKPAWEAGDSAPIATAAAAAAAAAAPATASAAVPAWKLLAGGDDADDDAAELEDEDALLAGDVLLPKPAADCGPTAPGAKKRACKNCSCGLKELEEAEEAKGLAVNLTDAQLAQTTSACGNCNKGDAFRCAGCPFRGKPSFKPGMGHMVLDLADDF